ncbi:MAG: hypothetical protein OES21_06115 [Myxococcales bacterium]|jgi:hypothetical protein|nr:hypothetical protein [Myxococcales bacterium]
MQLPEGSSSEDDIKAALMGGVPAGRWKEGLLFEGIRPQPWLKSAANWFPRTEDVQPNEMMLGWHLDAFSVFPVGKGHDFEVHEFDFRDNGGVGYDKHGVRVIHWQRFHAKDGASGYRLDWNGLCFVWTGDGRPSHLDEKYAKGCDLPCQSRPASPVHDDAHAVRSLPQ